MDIAGGTHDELEAHKPVSTQVSSLYLREMEEHNECEQFILNDIWLCSSRDSVYRPL